MLLLLAMMQVVDPDEVVTAPRLFARPACRQLHGEEILVCRARESDRIPRAAPRPDPMTVDRRPKIKIGDGLCLRVGFSVGLAAC